MRLRLSVLDFAGRTVSNCHNLDHIDAPRPNPVADLLACSSFVGG
ncbi:hypothetical protein CyaNS01_01784 [Cyanobium sp. NS01]|nr:hypothetical protein CyaNS01_01784 [Cyanobium sp. NS01]